MPGGVRTHRDNFYCSLPGGVRAHHGLFRARAFETPATFRIHVRHFFFNGASRNALF